MVSAERLSELVTKIIQRGRKQTQIRCAQRVLPYADEQKYRGHVRCGTGSWDGLSRLVYFVPRRFEISFFARSSRPLSLARDVPASPLVAVTLFLVQHKEDHSSYDMYVLCNAMGRGLDRAVPFASEDSFPGVPWASKLWVQSEKVMCHARRMAQTILQSLIMEPEVLRMRASLDQLGGNALHHIGLAYADGG